MVNPLKRFVKLFRRRETKPQKPVGTSRLPWFRRSRAGVFVDHDIALTYSAVYSAVRIISETLAALPWFVFSRNPGGGRDRQSEHTVDGLLNIRANEETTAFDFRQTITAHVLLWGNGFAEIERANNGVVRGLWLLSPDRVFPGRLDNGALAYEVQQASGDNVTIPARNMLHFRGMGFDGVQGYSVVQIAGQSMGLGLALERFGSEFFGNGAHPGGVLEHPATVGEGALDNMRKSLKDAVGTGQWSGTLILEEGMKWSQVGVPNEDSQFLESRKFQVTEVARWFRIQPHKLADLERATFSNVEAQNIEFVTDSLMPWAVRFENEVDTKLLNRSTPGRRLFSRHVFQALLRGDIAARSAFYSAMWDRGLMTRNEIRRLEDLNPLPGGDEPFVPMNMQPASQAGKEPPPAERSRIVMPDNNGRFGTYERR